MLDVLIILVKKLNFVTLRHNRFLKTIFETTLRCTLSTVRETHETFLSITGGNLEPLHVRRKFQPLAIVTKNSILDAAAPKLYFILICFCFKWFLQNNMSMYLGLSKKPFKLV